MVLELFWEASLTVKAVMLLLLSMSIYSWSIIISKTKELKLRKKEINDISKCLKEYENNSKAWLVLSRKNDGYFSNILKEVFLKIQKFNKDETRIVEKLENIKDEIKIMVDREMQILNKNYSILATIGSVSPYIGLFGTVYGIMISFIALGESTSAATLESVAPGIAEALIATGIGLFAAIPAYIFYNIFFNKISELEEEYTLLSEEFILNIKSTVNAKLRK